MEVGSFYSLNGSERPIGQWAVLPIPDSTTHYPVPNLCTKQSIQSAQRGVIGQLGGAGVCSLGQEGV